MNGNKHSVTGMSSNMPLRASAHTFFHLSFSHSIFSFCLSGSFVFECSFRLESRIERPLA